MPDSERAGLPVGAALHDTGLYLMLRQIGRGDLVDPFLFETVHRLPGPDTYLHIPRHELGVAPRGTEPAGLIFHISRSALLSQLLKQRDGLTVYSEPQAFNEILVPPHSWPRPALVAALRSLGAALARHAGGPYVVKFSSWNTLFCDLLAEAFPAAPWVFSHRDPLEVAASLARTPPGWFKNEEGRRLAAIVDPAGAAAASPEAYAACTIGALCQAGTRLDPRRGKLIAYDDLPSAAWDVMAPHFGLTPGTAAKARMAAAAQLNAKAPATAFVPDAAAKRAAASPALRQAVDLFARPALARLRAAHAG